MSMRSRLARPEWWTAISTGLLAVTTMGAVWYARGLITETREDSQIQHLLVLVNEFDQEPMATYRKGLANKRVNTKDDDPLELYRVLDFFETIGRLVDRGYLNEEDVWNEFGYWVLHLNADSEMRKNVDYEQQHHPNEYTVYLRLVARLQRIDAAHGGNPSSLSTKDAMDFYREELTIVGGAPITHGGSARTGK
jgi:hypothetical protein